QEQTRPAAQSRGPLPSAQRRAHGAQQVAGRRIGHEPAQRSRPDGQLRLRQRPDRIQRRAPDQPRHRGRLARSPAPGTTRGGTQTRSTFMSSNLLSVLQARMQPHLDRVMVEQPGGRRYSYADALAMTARLASRLAALDVQPGDRVAVQVDKSPETLLLYLACL